MAEIRVNEGKGGRKQFTANKEQNPKNYTQNLSAERYSCKIPLSLIPLHAALSLSL